MRPRDPDEGLGAEVKDELRPGRLDRRGDGGRILEPAGVDADPPERSGPHQVRLGLRVREDERMHLGAGRKEAPDERGADKPGRAGHEDARLGNGAGRHADAKAGRSCRGPR